VSEAPVRRPGAHDILSPVRSIPCTSTTFAELSVTLLRAGKSIRFRARGTSMHPLVRDGDVLLVRPVDARAVRVGDIVLCDSEPGRVVVHRVVRRLGALAGHSFVLQGDRAARPDGLVPEALVYGRLVAIERGGARVAVDGPVMRMLGRLAVLRSRTNLGRSRGYPLVSRLAKKLPVLSRYLS
jgi:signal peptidase